MSKTEIPDKTFSIFLASFDPGISENIMTNKQADLVGQTLGTCTLEKLLGQGGMGAVYLAQQARPARKVAVKVLRPHLSQQSQVYQEFLARFRREADVIANLEHVNIMPIYEYGEQDGLAYLVMPYLTGGSLRDLLAKQGPLSLTAAATYIDQAAAALDHAHRQNIIHRDLKPANFLLHADGRFRDRSHHGRIPGSGLDAYRSIDRHTRLYGPGDGTR
jgi:serine/threonine protein kinase